MWTTSTAGTLNTSWYLVGHPYWKQGINLLLPPAYYDSPTYWEDPWFTNGNAPHFWNSWYLFGQLLIRICYHLYKFLVSILQLSVLFPFLLFLQARFVANRKTRSLDPAFILALSAFLFPLGYLLINFESRYIWYLVPLSMVAGSLFLQDHLANPRKEKVVNLLPLIFALSYLIYPAWGMVAMYNEGVREEAIASQLMQLNIKGSYTAIVKPGRDTQRMSRLAYFSGNTFYIIPKPDVKEADVLPEMRRYHVKYFISTDTTKIVDEQGKAFPEVTKGSIDGLKVFTVNP
jgi:hypothetical protein